MTMFGFILIILVIAGLLSVKIVNGFVPLPISIRHFVHLLYNSEDLCQPIVTDSFPFYEKGSTKTYQLKPKYLDFYEIGFSHGEDSKLVNYSFKGKIKADFYWKDKLLFEKENILPIRGGYTQEGAKYFKETSFLEFGIPLQGKYKENISVKLTVMEPDENLKQYGDTVKLFIRVSPKE
jgi:hypothetical protein